MACNRVRFAYRFLPLPAWRAFLLDRHIDRCPRCQAQALGADAIRSLGVTPFELKHEPPLSPFAARSERPRAQVLRFGWRYAFGFFLAAAILWAAAAIARLVPTRPLPQGSVSVSEVGVDASVFAVYEARIGGEPARPVIFKPGRPGMTIVWFERIKN
jgi:hypothetical protein